MDRLDAMRLFIRVVERGSFSAVGREAGIGQSAVSKQIAGLETYLGAQLLRRTSRRMSLTEAGLGFYESARRLAANFEDAVAQAGSGQQAPSGLVRVTCAPIFGRLYIVPRLPAFFARYPDISVELTGTGRAVNLVEEGVDLAIRNGEMADSTLIASRFAAAPFATVATPAYLAARGTPQTPADLGPHTCLIFAPHQQPVPWMFQHQGETILHEPKANFRTADAEQIRAAVLAGLGLAQSPAWAFAPEIEAGTVSVVLAAYNRPPLAMSTVHPAGRLPARVRVFRDYLVTHLAADRAITGG